MNPHKMLKLLREAVPSHKNKRETKSTPNSPAAEIKKCATPNGSTSNKPPAPVLPPRPQPKSAIQSHPYLNAYQTPPPPQPLQLQIHQKHQQQQQQQMTFQRSMNRTRPTESPPPPPPLPAAALNSSRGSMAIRSSHRPLPNSANVSPDPSSSESAVCFSGPDDVCDPVSSDRSSTSLSSPRREPGDAVTMCNTFSTNGTTVETLLESLTKSSLLNGNTSTSNAPSPFPIAQFAHSPQSIRRLNELTHSMQEDEVITTDMDSNNVYQTIDSFAPKDSNPLKSIDPDRLSSEEQIEITIENADMKKENVPDSVCPIGHAQGNEQLEHGLPVKFVNALRQLFDVFDDRKCGFVSTEELRRRFECSQDQPPELLKCLQQAADLDGQVNFASFCAGIRACLLRSQNLPSGSNVEDNGHDTYKDTVEKENTINTSIRDMSLVQESMMMNRSIAFDSPWKSNEMLFNRSKRRPVVPTSSLESSSSASPVEPQVGLPKVNRSTMQQFALIGTANPSHQSQFSESNHPPNRHQPNNLSANKKAFPFVPPTSFDSLRGMATPKNRPSSVPADRRPTIASFSVQNLNYYNYPHHHRSNPINCPANKHSSFQTLSPHANGAQYSMQSNLSNPLNHTGYHLQSHHASVPLSGMLNSLNTSSATSRALTSCQPFYAELRSRAAVGSSDDLLDEQRRSQIMTRLNDWRDGVMKRGRSVDGRLEVVVGPNSSTGPDMPFASETANRAPDANGTITGQAPNAPVTLMSHSNGMIDSNGEPLYSVIEKRVTQRRREARRHTVTSAGEIQVMQTLQQLEQQKELLHQGAEMVDKASVWYRRQIQLIDNQIVSGKIRAGQYLTGSTLASSASFGHSERHLLDMSAEQQKEILNTLACKVLHINCQLRSLMEGDIRCKR